MENKRLKENQSAGKLSKKRLAKKRVKELTEGLFSSFCDFLLYWFLLLPVSSLGKSKTSVAVYQMFRDADRLHHDINYQTFKNAYIKLRRKGLIRSIKEWRNKKIATKEGIKRLKSILPFYDEKRFWDGNLYLVQYDIPRKQNHLRNWLRDWLLKKLRAIFLQESLYLIFFNPQELIANFLKDKPHFQGNILISKLEKDGILGEEKIEDFLWRKTGLEELNAEYQNFIDKYKNKKIKEVNLGEVFREFFSILNKDPQIPFELLPKHYLGDEAYLLFLKFFKNRSKFLKVDY
jgi:DNA-binding transcriptional regulator PaaX